MRLAVVSPFVDRRHGTERALSELLERLAGEYGCEIHLYAQHVAGLRLSDPRAPRSSKPGAIFWRKVPSTPGPHVVQFLAWMILNGLLRKWDKLAKGVSFDLVLSPGINSLHPDVLIVHALFHRLQELAREDDHITATQGHLFRRLHRKAYYGLLARLERRIYSDGSVRLAAVSQRTAGLLNHYFRRGDVQVIPNGVDTEYFTPAARLERRTLARQRRAIRDEDFVLLLIGNDWRVKGLPAVLEAMALLPGVPLHLLVVGNDMAAPFQSKAQQLGLKERCLWETPKLDVLDFFGAADIYVSPSREDSFGLPVAEAMRCGLPVITSRFAGIAEKVSDGEDGFVLSDPRDARSLSDLIQKLWRDTQLRFNIGKAASLTSSHWTWDSSCRELAKLLAQISAARGEMVGQPTRR